MALAAEVTQIICVADSSSSLQSKYFTISGMGTDFEQNDYYVWIEVGGSGATDPEPGGTGIKVSVMLLPLKLIFQQQLIQLR